jgi:hypothetical protein
LASVPLGATVSYGAKQLLHFTNMQMTNTAGRSIPLTNQDAVQVVAFFGDVTDTGLNFSDPASGAVAAISTVVRLDPNRFGQTLPGFAAFPNLDPVIIGSVSQQGGSIVPSDTTIINRAVTGGQPAIPWIPAGLKVAQVGPDPVLSVPTTLVAIPGGTVEVPVNIDTARPEGSTGMVGALVALTFDPKVFEVAAADVRLGMLPESSSGWQLQAKVNEATGQIGIWLAGNAIQSTASGSLVTITMHAWDTAPTGATPLTIVRALGESVGRSDVIPDGGWGRPKSFLTAPIRNGFGHRAWGVLIRDDCQSDAAGRRVAEPGQRAGDRALSGLCAAADAAPENTSPYRWAGRALGII